MRKATTLFAILASLLFFAFAYSMPASADPGGNNGTVKIHDTGTAVQDERNEPHVCNFYIDGLNFDGQSSGTWHIEGKAPSGSGAVVRNGTWGPADGSGNWHSSTMTLPNGHYELDAKQTAPGTPGGDKNKVFWVECGGGTTAGSDKGKADKAEADEDASGAPDTDSDAEDQAEATGQAVAGFQSPPSSGAVGAVTPIVELPGGSNQQSPNTAVNGVQTSPVAGVQSLPSTSTDGAPTIPLTALGLAMIAFGGVLLRRRDARI